MICHSDEYTASTCSTSNLNASADIIEEHIIIDELSQDENEDESQLSDNISLDSIEKKRKIDSDDGDGVKVKRFKLSKDDSKTKYVLKELPNLVAKNMEDEAALPHPFILPKHFKPDVAHALKLKQMTLQTNRSFLSSIAAAMFIYKKYPTADDYYNVARSIIDEYPFMKSPTGAPCVSIW